MFNKKTILLALLFSITVKIIVPLRSNISIQNISKYLGKKTYYASAICSAGSVLITLTSGLFLLITNKKYKSINRKISRLDRLQVITPKDREKRKKLKKEKKRYLVYQLLLTIPVAIGTAASIGSISVFLLSTRAKSIFNNSYEQDQCTICLEQYDENPDNQRARLHCGHNFHNTCVNQWFQSSNDQTCPTCRANVSGIEEIEGERKLDKQQIFVIDGIKSLISVIIPSIL